jgi:hypothetical protein
MLTDTPEATFRKHKKLIITLALIYALNKLL